MKRDVKETPPNVLEMIPTHQIDFEERDGTIYLLEPRFRNRIFLKYVLPRMKHPYVKIALDEFGTYVWKRINGHKTVYEIGNELKSEYGTKVEPVYERLGLFVNMLAQRQFVSLRQ